MEVRLVVCDIDNTLVVKHEPLSEYSKNIIKELKKRGILFGLASGRNVPMLRNLEEQWGVKSDLLIGFNGSEMYDGLNDKYEFFYGMEPAWIKQTLDIMRPFDTNVSLFRDGVGYVSRLDDAVKGSSKNLQGKMNVHVVENEEEYYSAPAPKIGFRVKAEDMPAIEENWKKYINPYFKAVKTENTMYEFCNINASKGKMLEIFCERHQIPLDTVWAFGDMTNDIDMLQTAGNAVCMLNGSDDCKAVADYITEKTIKDDGWGYFVEHHLLNDAD